MNKDTRDALKLAAGAAGALILFAAMCLGFAHIIG